jgi:hypothetical protein
MQKRANEQIYKKLEKRVVSIGGMLKGAKITEREIKQAKGSLFKSSI